MVTLWMTLSAVLPGFDLKRREWVILNQIRTSQSVLDAYTVKTGVSFRHSLRHRNSTSASFFSILKSVCLSGKTTLISVKTTLLIVQMTLPLSYRVLEMILLSAEIKSHSKVSKRHSKSHFQHSIR
jgi:hypothetical protein